MLKLNKDEHSKVYRCGYEVAWCDVMRHIKDVMKETTDINVIIESLVKYHDNYPTSYPIETIMNKLDELRR